MFDSGTWFQSKYDINVDFVSENPGTWTGTRAHIGFYSEYMGDDWLYDENYENCLVCFTTGGDGVIKKGTKGFGACWTATGSGNDSSPEWTQFGTVIGVSEDMFTQADTTDWAKSFTWNAMNTTNNPDRFWVASRHYSLLGTDTYIEFVSNENPKEKNLGITFGRQWL